MPQRTPPLPMLCLLIAFLVAPATATIWYVDDDAPLGGDGLTWPTAFRYLQDALWVAQTGDEIRVAGGTYTPDRDEAGNVNPYDRTVSFELIDGTKLYGGYAGLAQPGAPDERDIAVFESILSGDLLGNDGPGFANNWENSWRVVWIKYCGLGTVLDGFEIRYAYHLGGLWVDYESNPLVEACTFEANWGEYGGGLVVRNDNAATVTDCLFVGNRGYHGGGGVTLYSGSVFTASRCSFIGNEVGYDGGGAGGAMGMHDSTVTIVDSLFLANRSWQTTGGAIDVRNSEVSMSGCTVVGNWAPNYHGGGIHIYDGGPDDPSVVAIANSVFWWNGDRDGVNETAQVYQDDPWGTVAIDHSCIHGWTGLYGGVGNIGDDPLFVSMTPPGLPDDDLRLLPGSPCIDAGDNTALPADTYNLDGDCDTAEPIPYDLAGSPRVVDDPLAPDVGVGNGATVDMGAYEGADCNANGILDADDIAAGTSLDDNNNGYPDECEVANLTGSDPAHTWIDARQPHEPGGDPQGWQSILLQHDGTWRYLAPLDFVVSELGGDGVPPEVTCVEYVDDQAVRVHLSEPIEPVAWTFLDYPAGGWDVRLGFLPGDADGSRAVGSFDVLAVVDLVNEALAGGSPPEHQSDIDRSGNVTLNDVLRLIDLLNGEDGYPAYLGAQLPPLE